MSVLLCKIMFNYVLKIILFLSPLVYTMQISLHKFDLIFFQVGVSALFISACFSIPKRIILIHPMPLLLILCAINVFFSKFNVIVLSNYINVFLGVIGVYLIAIYCEDTAQYHKWILFAGSINILIFVAQKAGFSPIIDISKQFGQPGGLMGSGPQLVTYLTVILAFAPVWLAGIFIVIGIICQEFTIVGVAFIFFLIKYKYPAGKGYLKFIPILIFLTGLLFIKDHIIHSFINRWVIWSPTITQACQQPLAGHGLGIFSHVSDQFIKSFWHADNAFSSLLEFIFNIGFLGFVWVGYFLKKYVQNFKHNMSTLALLAIMILSLTEYPFEIIKLWLTIMVIVGFYFIENQEKITEVTNETIIRKQD